MKFKKEKPRIREMVLEKGIDFPSNHELVMLILGSGTKEMHVEELADKVMDIIDETKPDSIIDRLKEQKGIGETKAIQIAAALELGRRKNSILNMVVNRPPEVVPYVRHYALEKKEHFLSIMLNGAHEILSISVISIGTINRTIIHPREIFSEAIEKRASAIIVCHNHPYGSCTPSDADCDTTVMLKQASEILGIAFLDHIIITKDSYFSFMENRMLD